MAEEKKIMNIYQRMAKISEEMQMVGKNLKVGSGSYGYKAVGEADVLAAVKPLEAKYGVYSYPAHREVIQTDVLVSKKYYNNKESENRQLFMRVETTYRFVNIDMPSEFIDIITYGDGVDPQDKACGKAMTYADKYALLKAYKIETGEDPDQNMSEPLASTMNQSMNEPPTNNVQHQFSPAPYWSMLMRYYGFSDSLTEDEKLEVKSEALGYLLNNFNITSGAQITPDMANAIEKMCGGNK